MGRPIHDLTRDPPDLSLIGLSPFLPTLNLVLATGAGSTVPLYGTVFYIY